jgi:hypothetical protein
LYLVELVQTLGLTAISQAFFSLCLTSFSAVAAATAFFLFNLKNLGSEFVVSPSADAAATASPEVITPSFRWR